MLTNGLTGVPLELRREYRRRLQLIDPENQLAARWLWLWFAKEAYQQVGHPLIFKLCEQGPKEKVRAAVFAFVRQQITARQLYFYVVTNVGYAQNLVLAGILPEDFDFQAPWFRLIMEVGALECVAAYKPLVGLDILPDVQVCRPLFLAGIPVWYRYIDRLHTYMQLPQLYDLRGLIQVIGETEREILDSGDYTANTLTFVELQQLRIELGLPPWNPG